MSRNDTTGPKHRGPLARLARTLRSRLDGEFATGRSAGGDAPPPTLLDWARARLPDHFRRQPSAMHRWLAGELDAMATRRGARVNLIGPRGGAKSTVATLAGVLRAALEADEPYIWIVSDTKTQAHAHLDNVKSELLENRHLADAYPRCVGRGPRWRAGGIEMRNGVVVEAYGTGQRLRGRRRRADRPTLIVCDDLENDGHIVSPHRRAASSDWFHGTLLKAGNKNTNVVNLATALHRDALAMRLAEAPGWSSRTFKAITRWPRDTELWREWEAIYTDCENADADGDARRFYDRRCVAMNLGAEVLWPEEEDLYTLMRMRVEGGHAAFEREKQGSPIDPERCEWPEAYFDDACWFQAWPDALTLRTLAIDPSKGADARHGDYSAIVMLGVDALGIVHVQADLARRPTAQLIADGVGWVREFRPHAFGVEANQWQQLLAGEFLAESRRRGQFGLTTCEIHNHTNKAMRIRRLGPYLSQRRLRFKRGCKSTQLLVEQLRDFPLGAHDDGPDALEMALRLAESAWSERGADDGLGDRLVL